VCPHGVARKVVRSKGPTRQPLDLGSLLPQNSLYSQKTNMAKNIGSIWVS
jgi:hypothetical protein